MTVFNYCSAQIQIQNNDYFDMSYEVTVDDNAMFVLINGNINPHSNTTIDTSYWTTIGINGFFLEYSGWDYDGEIQCSFVGFPSGGCSFGIRIAAEQCTDFQLRVPLKTVPTMPVNGGFNLPIYCKTVSYSNGPETLESNYFIMPNSQMSYGPYLQDDLDIECPIVPSICDSIQAPDVCMIDEELYIYSDLNYSTCYSANGGWFCQGGSPTSMSIVNLTTDSILIDIRITVNGTICHNYIWSTDLYECTGCEQVEAPLISIDGDLITVEAIDWQVGGFDAAYIVNDDTTWVVTGNNPVYFPIPPVDDSIEVIVLQHLPGPGGDGFTCTYSEWVIAEVTTSSSSQSIITAQELLLYPNPASSVVQVKNITDIELISLYDLSGNLVMQQANSSSISIERLVVGTYIARIITKNGDTYSTKVIKVQ